MVETSPLNSSLKTFSFGFGASMITGCPLGRIMLGFPASVSASTFPMTTPWPVAPIAFAWVAWMLVRASGSTSGFLGDVLHNCCPSAAVAGMAGLRTREAATVFVLSCRPPDDDGCVGDDLLDPPGVAECPCLGRRHCRRDGVEERKGRNMRGPDLLQLGHERSLHGRGRCLPGVPVGPVRREVGELVVEHDHHALVLAGRAGFDLARAQLRKAGPRLRNAGPRHTGLGGRSRLPSQRRSSP